MAPTTRSQTADRARRPSSSDTRKDASPAQDVLPTYMIDLSSPPRERYTQLATDYRAYLQTLPAIFKEVVSALGLPFLLVSLLARVVLRRLASAEQTDELRGIAAASGLALRHLVAFNTALDALMGCTSGGVRVENGAGEKSSANGVLHFRTLDWGIDALRRGIVMLEFVDRPGGDVVARSITYAGFVGVLTGVRCAIFFSLCVFLRPHVLSRD